MKRLFDLFLSSLTIIIFFIPLLIIYLSIKIYSKGNPIYWSNRVGKDNKIFKMPKFRSMRNNTPELATSELKDPYKWLTPIGLFLRKWWPGPEMDFIKNEGYEFDTIFY